MSLNHLAKKEQFFIAEVHFLVREIIKAVLRCTYQGLGTVNITSMYLFKVLI